MSKELHEQLKAFVEHITQLEKVDEFDEDGFSKQFKELRSLGIAHREENKFPAEEGRKDENIKKNRYKDILPFDATRVRLKPKPDEPGSNYINANFVEGANGKRAYIASQGPLPQTVQDFWRMLWEYGIEVVVMVCQEVEGGKAKCERYWPKNTKEEKQFGDLHVRLVDEVNVSMFFFMRKLAVWESNKEDKKKTLTHFHYTGWMDHDIPHDFGDIVDLVNRMKQHQTNEDTPVVIHCSAGCGRTGTICAIDYVWNLLKGGMMTDDFNLYDIILKMRSQRQSMVQTPEQFKVVHLAVKEMFMNHIKQITLEQHNYENVNLKDGSSNSGKTVPKVISAGKDEAISKQKPIQGSHTTPASTVPKTKPTNINLTANTNVKPAGPTRKKPPTPTKPAMSPKPVTENEGAPFASLPAPQRNLSSSKGPDTATAKHLSANSYENTEIQGNVSSKTGQFVTKITVGQDSTAALQQNTSKTGNYQNSVVVNGNKTKVPEKAAPLNFNSGFHGQQKGKKMPAVLAQGANVSKKEQDLSSAGSSQADEECQYSVVSKPANSQGVLPGKRLANRAPVAIPTKAAASSGPYEDVDATSGKDYSYAEPNATDKWALQRLARHFDQMRAQDSTAKPPNHYEDINVNSPLGDAKLSISGASGEGAYASPDDWDVPPVPEKKPGAYVDEDDDTEERNPKNKAKTLFGKVLPALRGRGEADLSKGAAQAKNDDKVVLLNKKKIEGYKKRGDKPKGERPFPKGWRQESSL